MNLQNRACWLSKKWKKTYCDRFENCVNPGNEARQHTNPDTGKFVVRDEVTKEILPVGADFSAILHSVMANRFCGNRPPVFFGFP